METEDGGQKQIQESPLRVAVYEIAQHGEEVVMGVEKPRWVLPDGDYLEVRWNSSKDYDIHFKRFNRMGALLDWVEQNEGKIVGLFIFRKRSDDKQNRL